MMSSGSVQWLGWIEPSQSMYWSVPVCSLAKVMRTGVPVAPGFVISADASRQFFLQRGLRASIERAIAEHPQDKPALIAGLAQEIRQRILKAELPAAVGKALVPYLNHLEAQLLVKPGTPLPLTLVAYSLDGRAPHELRGSVHDLPSFTALYTKLIALFFSTQELAQRIAEKRAVMPAPPVVWVQFGEEALASGTGQQYDPLRHDANTLYVTAHRHASARAKHPAEDVYRFDKQSLLPLERIEGRQRFAQAGSGRHHRPAARHAETTVLSLAEQDHLARLIKQAQSGFDDPQTFSWVLAHDQFMITHVQPVAGEGGAVQGEALSSLPLLSGMPGNPGEAYGTARIVTSEADQVLLQPGEIAVVGALRPEDRAWLLSARAIIAEHGHAASVEAQVGASLGIPVVIGAPGARTIVQAGQLITVDGLRGHVYTGRVQDAHRVPQVTGAVTGTHLWAQIEDPLHVTRDSLVGLDGIGLLRGEFLLNLAGVHPKDIMKRDLLEEYTDILAETVERTARAAYPQPLIYQLHDVQATRQEPNPKLGYRGTHRLLREPEFLRAELSALASCIGAGLTNIQIMVPMVRTLKEAQEIQALLKQEWSLPELPPLWVHCETPALAIVAESLCKLPIQGVCFDVPALAQLLAGLDADNYQVGHFVDQAEQAVEDTLGYALATCRAHGVQTMLLAEGTELRAEVIEVGVRAGVNGLCVAVGEQAEVRALVASIEQRLLVEHLTA